MTASVAVTVLSVAVLAIVSQLSSAQTADVVGCHRPVSSTSQLQCRDPSVEPSAVTFPASSDDLCPPGSTIQCSPGLVRRQDSVITCLDNGEWDGTVPEWDGTVPECYNADCRPPGSNTLSQISFIPEPVTSSTSSAGQPHQTKMYRNGTKAYYRCDAGYVLLGDTVRVCEDGQWTRTAPHCYLNVAESSSLAVDSSSASCLADGNQTTFVSLLNLSGSKTNVSIDLYFPTRILQIRIIADKALQGNQMQISLMNGSQNIFGLRADLQVSSHLQSRDQAAVFIVFNDTRKHTRIGMASSITVSLPSQAANGSRPTPDAKLYELQIIADSTGLSWRQCLDDVGELQSSIGKTWAHGDWCYHLVTKMSNQSQAEEDCESLGDKGTLFRHSTGLNDMTLDILRYATDKSIFHHETRSTAHIWVHGKEDDGRKTGQVSPVTSESNQCLALSRNSTHTSPTSRDCGKLHPYICQRAPRLCGSPPQRPTLIYNRAKPTAEGGVINVTCVDTKLPSGQIQCKSRTWSLPDFCGPPLPTLQHGNNKQHRNNKHQQAGYLGAIIGGAVGGVIVMTVLALVVIRGRNGRRQRRRVEKPIPQVNDCSEFLGLNPNLIYGGSANDDEHLYSEVSDPEAIYEECFYSARLEPSPSPEPPPLPTTRPSVSSAADCSTPAPLFAFDGATSAPPISFDPDYEVFPAESAVQPGSAAGPHSPLSTRRSGASNAKPTPTSSAPFDPDYEAFPEEPQVPPGSATGTTPTTGTSSVSPALRDTSRPTLEYAVPLIDGRPAVGHEGNSSFADRPTDVRTAVPHISVGEEEDQYALPYRAEGYGAGGRRSIPDVAVMAMMVDKVVR